MGTEGKNHYHEDELEYHRVKRKKGTFIYKMLFRKNFYDQSEIHVLSVIQWKPLIFCFGFSNFHLLFTVTDGKDCRLIYKDTQPNAFLFQSHTWTRACKRAEKTSHHPRYSKQDTPPFKPTPFWVRAGR